MNARTKPALIRDRIAEIMGEVQSAGSPTASQLSELERLHTINNANRTHDAKTQAGK